jgi:hypothetical protein
MSELKVVGVAHLFYLSDSPDPRAVPVMIAAPAPARHHNLFALSREAQNPDASGFILSDGSFADRKRAAAVAIAADQIKALSWPPNLYSEDMW